MTDTAILRLNPEAYRMAKSMYRLFGSIARRDSKAVNATKPHAIIFPAGDATLQAAITTITDRLQGVITR